MTIITLIDEWGRMGPVGWAENDYGWLVGGKPIRLAAWQRFLLGEYWQRRDSVETLFISSPKKSGKTTLNSLLTCFRWLTIPGLHFAVGNDQDQSSELQINMIATMVKAHPVLKSRVKINKSELIFKPTESRLVSLPMDAPGAAGANFQSVSFTEIWAYIYEAAERLYDELTPPPLVNCLRIVDSYAGFVGESKVLERIWKRGEAGQRISEEWPLTIAGKQMSFIAVGEEGSRQTWRGTEEERQDYLRERLEGNERPGTVQRLHFNKWQQAVEDSFTDEITWQNCFDPMVQPLRPGDRTPVVIGLDLSRGTVKGDHIALVCVAKWATNDYAVKFVQNWIPVSGRPWNFDTTVGVTLDWLISNFVVVRVVYDAYEASHFISQDYLSGRVLFEAFGQQTERDRADSYLDQVIRSRQLHHYGEENLTQHILQARAKVSGKVRLDKSSQRRKIDLAVALSMATWRAKTLNFSPDPASLSIPAQVRPAPQQQPATPTVPALPANGTVQVIYQGLQADGSFELHGQKVYRDQPLTLSLEQFQRLQNASPPGWWKKIN